MYISKPSVTKTDRVYLLRSTSCRLNSTDLENLVKCLYPCSDMHHFIIVTKGTLAFRQILNNFIKPRSISKTTLHLASGSC